MSGDERVDGEGWRRGYDAWKADAPDTGAGGYSEPPCAVDGCGSTSRSNVDRRCGNGHTARQQDAAANAKRGW